MGGKQEPAPPAANDSWMGLSEAKFGEFTKRLVRFGPFLGAGGAALLLLVVPPGGHGAPPANASAASGHYSSPVPRGLAEAPTNRPQADAAAVSPADGSVSSTPSLDSAATNLASAPTVLSGPSPASDLTSSPAANSSSTESGSQSSDTAITTPLPSGPLTVAAKGWASREAGTPLAATGVPDGELPVGNRVGQIDKASFVRLSGGDSTLTLDEDTDNARSVAGPGTVQACPITATWTAADGMSMDQAPAYDASKCVPGKRADDNTWTFDLGSFSDRASGNGFALVPAPDAPVDFQVTFKAS